MKIDSTVVQALVAMAALVAGLYGVVTVPLLRRMDDVRADIVGLRAEAKADITSLRGDINEMRKELKEIGQRLTRVEERLPPPLVHR